MSVTLRESNVFVVGKTNKHKKLYNTTAMFISSAMFKSGNSFIKIISEFSSCKYNLRDHTCPIFWLENSYLLSSVRSGAGVICGVKIKVHFQHIFDVSILKKYQKISRYTAKEISVIDVKIKVAYTVKIKRSASNTFFAEAVHLQISNISQFICPGDQSTTFTTIN